MKKLLNSSILGITGIVAADTITAVPPEATGAVVVSGSHGGRYPGYQAARAQVRAVIFNDAGVGKDDAGIGALSYLASFGIAAAVVSHCSCRIGDTEDMLFRGIVSHVNAVAADMGAAPGQGTMTAATKLRDAPFVQVVPPALGETRSVIAGVARRLVLIDSAALVNREDGGQVIVTGSHGALVGGIANMALRVDGYAAAFNDAGGGADSAGFSRLAALDERGIAAFTVSATSARIGDARSTFSDGIVSAVNETARRLGANVGMRAEAVLSRWAGIH